jgi:putative radical SAM enzyme (TIGR03279 family)
VPKVVLSRAEPPPPRVTPARVSAVEPGSPADAAGVRAGWELLTVNGEPIPDVLAYRRELAKGVATLAVRDPESGAEVSFGVEWEEPGLEFDEVIFDGIRLCANHCDFCYVHQMPKGMRKSLYIMDDDFRTSFLYGSFVTLTNLTESDVERILDERLSPLYVSVHTADERKRAELMKWWPTKTPNPEATSIRAMFERLRDIDLYTQLVLVPGRNDGDELDATLEYLASRPNVLSVAAVPVGLTAHRGHLAKIEPYDREGAADVLRRVERWQGRMLAERGTRFVFASDELYLVAGRELPAAEEYEGFPMLENGVGMVRDFLGAETPALPGRLPSPRRVLLATGRLFAPVLEEAVAPLRAVDGLEVEVRALRNHTFGEVTTVAGLLAGRDVLMGVEPGEADLLLLSPNMLKYGTQTMLDDRTLADLERELRMPVAVGGTDLGELYGSVLRGPAGTYLPSFGFSTHAIKEAAKQH